MDKTIKNIIYKFYYFSSIFLIGKWKIHSDSDLNKRKFMNFRIYFFSLVSSMNSFSSSVLKNSFTNCSSFKYNSFDL